jgi:hypothetical protein
MKLNAEQIAEIIDTVKDGVGQSWVGQIYDYSGTPEAPKKMVNQVAFQVYLTTLNALISKMESVQIEPTPPPSPFEIQN